MGKCYIDSINDKFVLNGSNIAFNEFTKYANGKILTLDGVEIIDSTLLSRLTVSGGKLALDGILVNGLDLSNISANILPSADTMYNLGSTTKKYLRGYLGEVNTSTINLDSGTITYDGTNSLLKLGTDTIATREWVNSSAIPTLKTINGEVITGTGDITIVGGSGSSGQTYMDIQYAMMTGGVTVQAPNVFIPFATTIGDTSIDYIYKVDASTILIKAGVLYKLESLINNMTDDDNDTAELITYGLYSDVNGANFIKTPSLSTDYSTTWNNAYRNYMTMTYIKSDVDCYLKLKSSPSTQLDSTGFSLNVQTTLTKYNTTPVLIDANGSYTQGRQELSSYSSSETLTEKRWIDGKPIYRKVITVVPANSTGATTIIDANIKNNTTLLINSNIIVDESDGLYDKNISSNPTGLFIGTTSTGLYFGNSYAGNVGKTCYVWIEYTKSTDTASSPVTTIGGSGTPKKYFARISNGTATTLNRVQGSINIPLNIFVKGDTELSNGTTGFIVPQDDVYTIDFYFKNNNILNVNISNVYAFIYINGVLEQDIFQVNCNTTGERSINGSLSTRLNKNDVVTYKLAVWASDTTSALQIPIGAFIANIRN